MYRTHFLSLVVNHITENGLQENVKPVLILANTSLGASVNLAREY